MLKDKVHFTRTRNAKKRKRSYEKPTTLSFSELNSSYACKYSSQRSDFIEACANQIHQSFGARMAKFESKLLPLNGCLFTRLPCLFSYISWFFYRSFSSFLSPNRRKPCNDSFRSCLFSKSWSRRKKDLFLVPSASSLWGKDHFCCVGIIGWVTGGDWGGVALFDSSAAEGSANFLLQNLKLLMMM